MVIPLKVKIAGWWIRIISLIAVGISIAMMFFWLGAIIRGCDKNAGLCAPGAECDIPCSGFTASLVTSLFLVLIPLAVAILLFLVSRKLFNGKKTGWRDSLIVLVLINGFAIYIFTHALRDISPLVSFTDAIYFILLFINFIPLVLLLLGRREFFKIAR